MATTYLLHYYTLGLIMNLIEIIDKYLVIGLANFSIQ